MTTMLRDTWGSDAAIQTDCCDSISSMSSFRYKGWNYSQALAAAVNDGLQVYFGYDVAGYRQFMADNIGNGTIAEATVRRAGRRVLLSFLRLGFFDQHAADYPFANDTIPWSLLDSDGHRALAREAAAKSTVLLKNTGVLPVDPSKVSSVAVIGPFAQCDTGVAPQRPVPASSHAGCYLHSYNGNPSNYTTILGGVRAAFPGAAVSYAHGCNSTCGWICDADLGKDCWSAAGSPAAATIAAAATAAAAADITVLAVGLGAHVEGEGCDRFSMRLPAVQRALQAAVSRAAKRLIVVVVSAGGVDVDEQRADAVLWAPYGGEEAGSGVADVLTGRVNPSARAPAWYDGMAGDVATSMLSP
eukprot:gene26884-34436_t